MALQMVERGRNGWFRVLLAGAVPEGLVLAALSQPLPPISWILAR